MSAQTETLRNRNPRFTPRTRRQTALLLLLLAVVAAYFATAGYRARVADVQWRTRQSVIWAEQQQEDALARRRLRADLRAQLRRLADEPEDSRALLGAASLYGQLSQYDDELFLLGEAERLRPGDPEVFRAKGQAYLGSGQYDRCLEAADRGLAIAPDDLELNLIRINVDTVLGWVSDSHGRMRHLLELYGSREPRVHVMAALVARQVADAKGSLAHLRQALKLDSSNDKVYAILSGLEWELGHKSEAMTSIRRSLELNAGAADSWIHLAEMQQADGGVDGWRQAEQSYRKALDLSPANRQAKYGVALCRLRLGDPEGQSMLEHLVREFPHLPAPLLELAKIYNKQGRRREAAALLTRYDHGMQENDRLKGLSLRMAMKPNDVDTYLEMGRLHMETGYPEKAIVVLRRALRLDPSRRATRQALVEALAQAGRAGEIAEILKQD